MPLELVLPAPGRQSRLTVLARVILMIPCQIALYLYSIPASLLQVVGWFCALGIGRLPRPIARYQVWYLRYSAQVSAYSVLLTGSFPGFGFDDDHPVEVTVIPDEVSRLTVFFRLLMAIPASIVAGVLRWGLLVMLPFLWIITLVRGQLPRAGFDAMTAIVRYELRYGAWFAMVNDEYPGGVFEPLRIRQAGAVAPPLTDPVIEAAAVAVPAAREATAFREDLEPAFPAAAEPVLPAVPVERTPAVAWVPLSDGGRRLLKLSIPFGIVGWIGTILIWSFSINFTSSTDSQKAAFDKAYAPVVVASSTFLREATACGDGDDALRCTQAVEAKLSTVLLAFVDELEDLRVPEGAVDERIELQVRTRELGNLLERMSTAPTEALYNDAAAKLQDTASAFDGATQALRLTYD